MEIRKLDITNGNEISFVENLYIESFPLSERRPVEAMLDLYKGASPFVIAMILEDDNTIGFFSYWDLDEFIFAEHFAISPGFRNEGYGRKAMDLFMKDITRPVVLEVELPATILSERRIGFYQRIGFKLWENVQYQQPAYHKDGIAIPMKLMTYGNLDMEKDLIGVRSKLYGVVYNC
ncbi:MAG: GNAT family N-acetyltransferase [Prevotella sp.]|jgi:RimJ/RimL family protein N-acetyltransferase|nr:GNAT family N-acetyltransferase [Prevotella sp.]